MYVNKNVLLHFYKYKNEFFFFLQNNFLMKKTIYIINVNIFLKIIVTKFNLNNF